MSQGPLDEEREEERLSRTPIQQAAAGLQGLSDSLGWLSAALVLVGIAGLALGVVLSFIQDLRVYSYIILIIAGVLLLVALIISFRSVGRAVTSRRGRYSTNTTVMVTAFVGIVAVVNFLAFENTARMDVTATRQFSLAERTVNLLKDLPEPVEAKAFFEPGGTTELEAKMQEFRNRVEDVLREFQIRSGNFSYQFYDPIVDPGIASEYEATDYPTIVFENTVTKIRQEVPLDQAFQFYDAFSRLPVEQNFVTGLLIVTNQEQKRVYVLTGHGEREFTDFEVDTPGFGLALDGIASENYLVSPLNLLVQCSPLVDPGCSEPLTGADRLKQDSCELPPSPAPSEAEEGNEEEEEAECERKVNMLVIAGPTSDLLEGEAEVLDDYLRPLITGDLLSPIIKPGGKILMLLDPETPQSFRDFLARWGAVLGDGHIIDLSRSAGDNNEIAFIARDQYFPAVPQLTDRLDTTYFPGVTALKPAEDVVFFPELTQEEEDEQQEDEPPSTTVGAALALTSENSWLIDDPTRNVPNEETDEQGPFFPAVVFSGYAPVGEEVNPGLANVVEPARLVIYGDSDFATNRYFYTSSNSDLFLNSVNWLVGDEDLTSIRPKPVAPRTLVVTSTERNFIRYTSWFLLPALMAVAGGYVWWRRR